MMPTKRQWLTRITAAQAVASFIGGTDENLEEAIRKLELEQWRDALRCAAKVKGVFIPVGVLVSQAADEMMKDQEQEKPETVEVLKR